MALVKIKFNAIRSYHLESITRFLLVWKVYSKDKDQKEDPYIKIKLSFVCHLGLEVSDYFFVYFVWQIGIRFLFNKIIYYQIFKNQDPNNLT